MPNLHLGDIVPNFIADSTQGKINFYEWQENQWVVLFSHPADFTPICTTELGKMAIHEPYFTKRNVKLLAHSIDDFQTHKDWIRDLQEYCREIPGEFPYPIICDPNKEIAILLDMINPNITNEFARRETVRALYIIDPKHVLRLSLHYPNSTGRSVDEIIRVIDSLQLTDRVPQVGTPANWKAGEKVLVLPSVSNTEVNRLFPEGVETVNVPSGKNYMRKTTVPMAHAFFGDNSKRMKK